MLYKHQYRGTFVFILFLNKQGSEVRLTHSREARTTRDLLPDSTHKHINLSIDIILYYTADKFYSYLK